MSFLACSTILAYELNLKTQGNHKTLLKLSFLSPYDLFRGDSSQFLLKGSRMKRKEAPKLVTPQNVPSRLDWIDSFLDSSRLFSLIFFTDCKQISCKLLINLNKQQQNHVNQYRERFTSQTAIRKTNTKARWQLNQPWKPLFLSAKDSTGFTSEMILKKSN